MTRASTATRSTLSAEPSGLGQERLRSLTPLFLAALILWLRAPQGLMWFDSGELALAAATWGLAHPPGQPLYAALSALAYQLGGLSALNLLSALALVSLLASLRAIERRLHGPLSLGAELLGLIWICLYPVWDQGARVELYSLASALGAWSLYWSLRAQGAQGEASPPLYAGALLGACGATNAIFAIAFGLSLLWLLSPWRPRAFGLLALGTALGFGLPHLYMLWAVSASTGFVWGDFSSLEGALHYLSGADYRGTGHSAWSSASANLLEWVVWSFEVGAGLWCTLAALSFVSSLRARRWWALPLITLCGLFPLSYERYWPEVPDFTGYLLPIMGLSLLSLWRLEARLRSSARPRLMVALLLSALLLAPALSAPVYRASRASHELPTWLAARWLESLPRGSALLLRSDHWVFPLMFLQEAQGLRPDVLIFNVGFSRSAWYWRWLRARHPQLPRVEGAGAARLHELTREWSGPVYAEDLSLALSVSPRLELSASRPYAPPCPASWGVSVGCERPLPPPDATALRQIALSQRELSPISARVLAAHSLTLSLSYWSAGDAASALSLGYAALGEPLPQRAAEAQWWPAPPQLWAQGRALLIAEPALALAVLEVLSQPPQARAPSAKPSP